MSNETKLARSNRAAVINKPSDALAALAQDLRVNAERDLINVVLNTPPPADWVKLHPMSKTPYLPIGRVETLLTQIFQVWNWKVIGYNVIANSVCVHGTLTVQYPNGDIRMLDGLGAAPIQTKSGASPVDHSAVLTDAVMKALPAAESYALKDAADKLGKLFGSDLGRKDSAEFKPQYSTRWSNHNQEEGK